MATINRAGVDDGLGSGPDPWAAAAWTSGPAAFPGLGRIAPLAAPIIVDGTEGDDADLRGPRPAPGPVTINGRGGNDVITGDQYDDILNGGTGNDTIFGGLGADTIHGDAGDDIIETGGGGGTASGDDGNDQIYARTGAQTGTWSIDGGAGDDFLVNVSQSVEGRGTILGGTGNDRIISLYGNIAINAGADNDIVTIDDRLGSGPRDYAVTLGGGADLLSLARLHGRPFETPVIVADFVPGLDNVSFDVLTFLGTSDVGGAYTAAMNPFATGHARLLQSGTDTILQIDVDGGGNGFGDFIRFANIAVAAFDGTSLGGANVGGNGFSGVTAAGGIGNDFLIGGLGNDVLSGASGDDTLNGGAGDDIINGGSGNDTITVRGGTGIVHGDDGNDTIFSYGANDQLFGDAGDDAIVVALTGGTRLTASGGTGNDTIQVSNGVATNINQSVTLFGNDGDDRITLNGFGVDNIVDAGTGNDIVTLGSTLSARVTLGPGADTLRLDSNFAPIIGGIIIADYEAGIDTVDFSGIVTILSATDSPFDAGKLRITADGGDTLLQFDANGGGDQLVTILRFENVAPAQFGAADFGGFAPGGGPAVGQVIHGTPAVDRLTGGYGDDLIYGEADNDDLVGSAGNDILFGGAGADHLDGGTGTDTASYADDTAALTILLDTGTATGGTAEGDTLTGIENVIGGSGDDVIRGNALANVLDGGAGVDRLFGGQGDDTYIVDTQADLVFENPGAGTDTVLAAASFYLYANVENLTLTGAGNSFGVGNERDNILTGNSGENLLIAGAGNDTIRGGAARDALFGEGGDDQLFGDAGIDYIVAGAGNDSVDGGADADEIYGEDGDDILIGGSSFDTDILVGGAGNDTLRGDSGLGDFDFLYGNAGDDIFHVDTPADLVFEQAGEGFDTVFANINGAGFYLYENIEDLVLLGTTPFGVGNGLDNRLTGNAIGNYLLGGSGDDTLNGKAGNDVLFGEAGADTFVFERGTGGDVIGDFQVGVDKILLTGLGISSFAQLQASLVENAGTTAIDLGLGDLIVINGITNAQLSAGDFLFA